MKQIHRPRNNRLDRLGHIYSFLSSLAANLFPRRGNIHCTSNAKLRESLKIANTALRERGFDPIQFNKRQAYFTNIRAKSVIEAQIFGFLMQQLSPSCPPSTKKIYLDEDEVNERLGLELLMDMIRAHVRDMLPGERTVSLDETTQDMPSIKRALADVNENLGLKLTFDVEYLKFGFLTSSETIMSSTFKDVCEEEHDDAADNDLVEKTYNSVLSAHRGISTSNIF